MPTATITVQYVNPPAAGKKQGNIKTTDGEYFGVWPDKLHLFSPNQTYTFDYETSEYKGKTYKTFKEMRAEPKPLNGQAHEHDKSEELYTLALLKSFIEAGRVDLTPESIVTAGQMIRDTRSRIFGEMDDLPGF